MKLSTLPINHPGNSMKNHAAPFLPITQLSDIQLGVKTQTPNGNNSIVRILDVVTYQFPHTESQLYDPRYHTINNTNTLPHNVTENIDILGVRTMTYKN